MPSGGCFLRGGCGFARVRKRARAGNAVGYYLNKTKKLRRS